MYNVSFGASRGDSRNVSVPVVLETFSSYGNPKSAAEAMLALEAFVGTVGGVLVEKRVIPAADMNEEPMYAPYVVAQLPLLPDVTQWVMSTPVLGSYEADIWRDTLKTALSLLPKTGAGGDVPSWQALNFKEKWEVKPGDLPGSISQKKSWRMTLKGTPTSAEAYAEHYYRPEEEVVEEDAVIVPAAAAALSTGQKVGLGVGLGLAGAVIIGGITTAVIMKRREER
jgi:hypothetical protein